MKATYKTFTRNVRMTDEDQALEAFYQQQARIKKNKATRQARRATPQGGGNWIGYGVAGGFTTKGD